MKNYALLILAFVALAFVAACGSKNKSGDSDSDKSSKYLVLYYSQTGATKTVAEELQKQLGADIEEIEVDVPYDSSYEQTIERAKQERESGELPKVKPLVSNIDDYEVIFLGYPIWFGTYALPIASLVKDYDFAGKKVVPFCTFGSGGLESSAIALKEALPNAEIADGYGVRNARIAAAPKEIDRFLKEDGYVEGSVEALPEYSEQQPVTDEDAALFNAACGSYKFPLGTPETVAKRTTSEGTDYKFNVKGTGPTGEVTMSTIYVTVGAAEGSTPEFTRVERWMPL